MNLPDLDFEPEMTYVLGFAFTNDRVLLIVKNRPQWQAGLLNGVGGKVEPDDWCYEAAMQREFKEEVGVDTELEKWSTFAEHVKPPVNGEGSYHLVVLSTDLTDEQVNNLKEPTDEVPLWYKLESLGDLLSDNVGVPGVAMYIAMALNHRNCSFKTMTIETT